MRCIIHAPATNSLNPRNRNSEYRFESHRGNLESFRPRNSLGLGVCTYNYLDATQLEPLTATLLQFLSLSLSLSLSALSLSLSLFPWLIIFAQIEYLTNVFLFFSRGKIGCFFRFSPPISVVLILQRLNRKIGYEFLWPTTKGIESFVSNALFPSFELDFAYLARDQREIILFSVLFRMGKVKKALCDRD